MLNINEASTTSGGTNGDEDDDRSPAGASGNPLIDEVVEAFTAVRGRGSRAFRRLHHRSLSMGHLHVLARVQAAGPLPVSHLARSLGVSAASATGMIGRMEERGLVQRVPDERDRRVVLVHLTPAGQAVLDDIGTRSRAALVRVLSRLDERELTHLRDGLRAFRRASEALAEADGAHDHGCAPADEEAPHAAQDPD